MPSEGQMVTQKSLYITLFVIGIPMLWIAAPIATAMCPLFCSSSPLFHLHILRQVDTPLPFFLAIAYNRACGFLGSNGPGTCLISGTQCGQSSFPLIINFVQLLLEPIDSVVDLRLATVFV
jgi:hypothetical protein